MRKVYFSMNSLEKDISIFGETFKECFEEYQGFFDFKIGGMIVEQVIYNAAKKLYPSVHLETLF